MKIDHIDFDVPFSIGEDQHVVLRHNRPELAADVYSAPGGALEIQTTARWEALTGHSGQQSYSGPIMHSSECIGGGLEEYLLATPGTYMVTTVIDGEDPNELVGWAILRLKAA